MLDSGALVKLSHCFENKGPADIPSCLYYGTGHGHKVVPMTDDEELLIWLSAKMTEAYDEFGPFVELGFVSDAFGREFYNGDAMREALKEMDKPLSEQHATDPSAQVKEILVAYAVFGDGTEAGGISEYVYGDDGLPSFGAPVVSLDEAQGGLIPFILRSFYTFLNSSEDEG